MTKSSTQHRMCILALLSALAVGTALATDPPARSKRTPEVAKPVPAAESIPPTLPDPQAAATVVSYGEKDLVPVKTKLRYTTLIVLPSGERILDFTCGDKEFWIVSGNENLAYVKPAKLGAETNLNLVTASGNIYSFVLREVSEQAGAQPDLKVFVELRDGGMSRAVGGTPAFVSASEITTYRKQVEVAKDEVRQVKQSAQAAITDGINTFITNVRFPYSFEAGKKPFNVRAMYHDDKFTYVQARPEEAPALYEVRDGQASLVNFSYENGVYVARKILHRGYLAIGKQKLDFTSEE